MYLSACEREMGGRKKAGFKVGRMRGAGTGVPSNYSPWGKLGPETPGG